MLSKKTVRKVKTKQALWSEFTKMEAQIIDLLPDATFVIDTQGRIRAWNQAIVKMTGTPISAVLGKGNYEYSYRFYGSRRPAMVDLLIKPSVALRRRYKHVSKDGNSIVGEAYIPNFRGKDSYLWIKATKLFDQHGKFIGAIESIRDVTEQRVLEQQLMLEKKWSERLIAQAPNFLLGLDKDCKITLFNNFAEKLTGYKSPEVLGKSWPELFIPKPLRPSIQRVWQEVMQNEKIDQHFTNPVLTKKGTERLIFWSNTFLKEAGHFKMVLSAGLDMTEKIKADEELTKSKQRYELATNILGQIFYEYDSGSGKIEWFGPIHEVTGFSEQEFQHVDIKKWEELIHPDDRKRALAELAAAEAGIGKYACEYRFKQRNSKYIYVLDEGSYFKDAQSGKLRMLGSMRDITEKYLKAERIRLQTEKLERLNRAMIGREKKMIELKVENAALKKTIEKRT